MAGRTRTTPAKTTAPEPTDDFGLTVTESTGVVRADKGKERKPIATLRFIKQSLDTGTALAFPQVAADKITNLYSDMTRAATELECSLSKSKTDNGDGTFRVDFLASPRKRRVQYSGQDVRDWAAEHHFTVYVSRAIPKAIRAAFRLFKGIDTPTDKRVTATRESLIQAGFEPSNLDWNTLPR